MRTIIYATIALLSAASPLVAQTATEKAEKRLAELVAPRSGPGTFASKPVEWKPAPAVDNIVVADKPLAVSPGRLPVPAVKEIKPRSAPEATPLVSSREQPKGPKDVQLPTKPLIKLPSVDATTPLPIPILAQPVKDRASLADPAMQASLKAAMKPITAKRDRPVPFSALNLPDPFENARYGQLRNPPEEDPMPPVIPLIKPKQ